MYRALHQTSHHPATTPLSPQVSQRVLRSRALRVAAILVSAATALSLAGCGVQYRPVVSAINPVGPAGQPTKYAVAVSNPSSVLQDSITGYSISANVATFTVAAPNPFLAGQTLTLAGFPTSLFLNGQSVTVLTSGLTNTQFQANLPSANAAATENGTVTLTTNLNGLVTFIDFSGDTVLSTPSILKNTSYFALNNGGSQGFVINAAGSLNDFPTSNPTSLITSEIVQTTLPANSAPVSISAITPSNGTSAIFIPQAASSSVAVLSTATASLLQQLTVGTNPVYVVGADNAPRIYAISQGSGGNGQIAAIEATSASSLSISTTIPVDINPVYGVMTADDKRTFILNKGSGTVSVVNVVTNALDATTPTIRLPTISYPAGANAGIAYAAGTSAPNPVWADFSPTTSQLVVLNQGDGTHPGSLSLINIPLCSSITQTSNPNCNAANPADSTGFGVISNTANVGINPVMVSVLRDGTAAYVVNAGILPGVNPIYPNGVEGSVSVVSLVTGVVTATLPAVSASALTTTPGTSPTAVYGHPTTVSATTGTPTGKVYITSPDNQYLTILYTNTNTVIDHINLQGKGVRVLVNQP